MQVPGITSFERRRQRLVSGRHFADRMLKAIGLWCIIALVGLAIGMAGYSAFEDLSLADAYVNAAMILAGMGPMGELKTTAGKIFAGSYAIFSSFAYHRNRLRVGSDLPPHIAPFPRGDP